MTTNAHSYDVIIVGSGAGGSAAAYQLVSAGLRVLLVEKGMRLARVPATLDIRRVVHEGAFKSHESWRDGRGQRVVPEEYFNVGGKTKWYGAALLRYGDREFDGDAAFQCMAWPIKSNELAPYYATAESRLGAREFACEPHLGKILAKLAVHSPEWDARTLPPTLT